MTEVFSFDIFDTLLTRKVASPSSVFLIVGDRAIKMGLLSIDSRRFQNERIKAEEGARRSAPGREATFAEIYDCLTVSLGISHAYADALAKLELDVESKMFVPVPGAVLLVRKARERASCVLFVSDMYLPVAFLREELSRHSFFEVGDKIYVSNELRASKADGSLFRKILEIENYRPRMIRHLGDRQDADVEVPLKLGFRATLTTKCHLNRHEELFVDHASESAGFSSFVAGVSRLTRLQVLRRTPHLKSLVKIASSVVAPVITFYATWILSEASRRGLKRLYFVARDGFLVKQIVDALIVAFNLSIETRYLYGSRQSWHLPAISKFSSNAISWLFERTRTINLRIVLGRLQITPEEIHDILCECGWPKTAWENLLDESSLEELKASLFKSVGFCQYVEERVVEKRELALQYFAQEGLFDHCAWAIVDLGWHGRLQQSLQTLLETRGQIQTIGLYFGLYSDSAALTKLSTVSYLGWDLRHPPILKDIPSLVFLMESFCTARHGSTVGYSKQEGGRIVPRLREGEFAIMESWGISTVHETVEKFAENLKRCDLTISALNWDSRSAVVRCMRSFSISPHPSEARAWGSFPYEDEQAGMVRERLTAPYELTWQSLKIALTYGAEQFLPDSWNILWHGAQPHVRSVGSTVLRIALKLGWAKRALGQVVRRIVPPQVC